MIEAHSFQKISNISHGFLTREGGVSSGCFNSLNCGFGTGDDPVNVSKNRAIAMEKVGLGEAHLNTAFQRHTKVVAVAKSQWTDEDRPIADAIVTKEAGLAIGILTADCVPVLFVDSMAGVIGVSHAGWRGALSGVLEACVSRMESLGATRRSILAAIGPSIHQTSYEVDFQFKEVFLNNDSQNIIFFCSSSRKHHFYFDLPGYVLQKLEGLLLKDVFCLGLDTYTDEKRFFSYRRSVHLKEQEYGRALSLIALTE